MILLVAIVAAIALTLRTRKDTQAPGSRRRRSRSTARDRVRIVKMPAEKANGADAGSSGDARHDLTLGHFLVARRDPVRASSVVGIFLNRKNLIVLLMAIELMLLAVNMNFVAFSHYLGDIGGQVFVFFILTVAAAESAIGLAILVVLFRNARTINVDDLDTLKG